VAVVVEDTLEAAVTVEEIVVVGEVEIAAVDRVGVTRGL
jgi:hypothetical protein